jgi:Carboxypeptidase regulatory-like domain
MRATKPALPALSAALSLIFLACPVAAQVLYGSLTGNVTDATGGVIPGVKVEALNIATGIAKQAVTDDRGAYLLSDLQPGTYKVTIAAPSFTSRVFENAVVSLNSVLRLDATLALSQVVETVQVSAGAVVLQTDRADINNQIRSTQIVDLPLINSQGRNFQILYKILPGFTPPVEAHSDSKSPAIDGVAGQRHAAIQQQHQAGRRDHQPPMAAAPGGVSAPVEAVETVNVVSNSFDGEQGMAGGAVMNVTIESGTNAFHGAGWEFLTNSALKAPTISIACIPALATPTARPRTCKTSSAECWAGRS